MKKFLSVAASFICLIMMFSLIGCVGNPNGENPPQNNNIVSDGDNTGNGNAGNDEDSEQEAPSVSSSADVLIVYFSATNNTERVAQYIADATGGKMFELEPVEPYSRNDLDYNNHSSRVYREYENVGLRDIALKSTTVDNWADYDTLFIGYPIWWGIAAWPVNNFIKNNDFTGKTVIPFATSSSSGLGQSGTLLAQMAGTGNWLEGQRFRSSESESAVRNWIQGLNLAA